MRERVFVQASIHKSAHSKLVAIAKDRRMTLAEVLSELAEWGAEKDALELYRLGVRFPLFPGESPPGPETPRDAKGSSKRNK